MKLEGPPLKNLTVLALLGSSNARLMKSPQETVGGSASNSTAPIINLGIQPHNFSGNLFKHVPKIPDEVRSTRNRYHLREGMLIGDKHGLTNGTELVKQNRMHFERTTGRPFNEVVEAGDTALTILASTVALSVVGTVACIFIPSCPAAVGTALGKFVHAYSDAAGVTREAGARLLETAASSGGQRYNGTSFKRSDQVEKFACADKGDDGACDRMDGSDYIMTMLMGDEVNGDVNNQVGESIWELDDMSKGIIGYTFHCIGPGDNCSFDSAGGVDEDDQTHDINVKREMDFGIGFGTDDTSFPGAVFEGNYDNGCTHTTLSFDATEFCIEHGGRSGCYIDLFEDDNCNRAILSRSGDGCQYLSGGAVGREYAYKGYCK